MDMVRHILLSHNKDSIIQGETVNGIYTVASSYETLQNYGPTPMWAKAWYLGLIPKINIFFWIMLQNHILMVDNLTKRGNMIPNRCILCKNHYESAEHIFIHILSSKLSDLFSYLFSTCPSASHPTFWGSFNNDTLECQGVTPWLCGTRPYPMYVGGFGKSGTTTFLGIRKQRQTFFSTNALMPPWKTTPKSKALSPLSVQRVGTIIRGMDANGLFHLRDGIRLILMGQQKATQERLG